MTCPCRLMVVKNFPTFKLGKPRYRLCWMDYFIHGDTIYAKDYHNWKNWTAINALILYIRRFLFWFEKKKNCNSCNDFIKFSCQYSTLVHTGVRLIVIPFGMPTKNLIVLPVSYLSNCFTSQLLDLWRLLGLLSIYCNFHKTINWPYEFLLSQ